MGYLGFCGHWYGVKTFFCSMNAFRQCKSSSRLSLAKKWTGNHFIKELDSMSETEFYWGGGWYGRYSINWLLWVSSDTHLKSKLIFWSTQIFLQYNEPSRFYWGKKLDFAPFCWAMTHCLLGAIIRPKLAIWILADIGVKTIFIFPNSLSLV